MQIHELSRKRRTDEGFMDVVKGVGGAAKTALATAAGIDPNAGAASAGILDPKQKLAAVMKNPDMVKLATQYADEWVQKQGAPAPAQAQAVPEDTAVATPGTYNKKTGAAKLGGKTMTALSDLPPHIQQQIQAKQDLEQQTGRPNPYTTPAAQQPAPTATQTTAPADAQRFNYNNVAKMPGVANATTATQAQPTTATQAQPTTGSTVNKANPNNPNIKDQTKYVQGRAGSGAGSDATKFAKYDPATSAMARADQGINNMVRGGAAAQQQAAPAKTTGTTMPTTPYQVPGAGTNPNPNTTKPGQPAKTTGTTMPTAPFQTPGAGTNPNPTTQTKPQIPASIPSDYINDFEAWADKKIAMRDPTTYRAISLPTIKNTTNKENLKTEIEKAKQEVIKAQGDPAKTKEAVKNYILTALAAGQLIASQNKVAAATTAPEVSYQQRPLAGQTNTTSQSQPIDITAALQQAGLDTAKAQKVGQVMQLITRNNKLRATGDDAIDGMLSLMGYKVS